MDVQVSLPGTTSGDSNTIISTETNVGVITVVEEDGSVHAEVTIGGVTSTTDSLPLPEDGAPVSVGFSLDTTTSELVVSVQPADGSPIVYSDPVTGVVVSMSSASERKPAPRSLIASTRSSRSRRAASTAATTASRAGSQVYGSMSST